MSESTRVISLIFTKVGLFIMFIANKLDREVQFISVAHSLDR